MRIWNARALLCTGLEFGLLCFSPFLLFSQRTADASPGGAGKPAYGGCPAPSHEGVMICAPALFHGVSEIDAPFQLIASGTSSKGQVKLMELWADGKKVTQTAGTPFDEVVILESGTHELTVVELDTTGAYVKSAPFQVTVEGNNSQTCSPPSSPGVHVCDPLPNSCHTAPWTTVFAAGTGKNGTVSRMELWINGVKIGNFPGNRVSTNLYVTDFSRLTIVEVDSKGASIKSLPIVVQSC
jgi:hypothetical protein